MFEVIRLKNKLLLYGLPCIILIISIIVMTTGGILKKPIGKDDDVTGYIHRIENNAKSDKWKEAEKNSAKLYSAWNKVAKRIQFSVERSDMSMMYVSISRIRGAVKAKDKNSAIIETSEALEHWDRLED